MTPEALNVMKEWMRGLTLEEWRAVRAEIDQQFEVKALHLYIEASDMHEITRAVALRMDLYTSAEEAVRQTKMSL